MKTMLVSEFKAKCIAALKEVQRSREPMLVTVRGKPLVTIQPVGELPQGKRLGGLKGKMTIHSDLVRIDSTEDWEMHT
ncbi:MAG: type II toxin-antitoxin system prevent-host-death family antitoxin [Deltaproteobacteria bacterium]|nr:type II toxin-antitoxin system prevent-host-death family antitoxin [Deltaproteobacteria bacterium]